MYSTAKSSRFQNVHLTFKEIKKVWAVQSLLQEDHRYRFPRVTSEKSS